MPLNEIDIFVENETKATKYLYGLAAPPFPLDKCQIYCD